MRDGDLHRDYHVVSENLPNLRVGSFGDEVQADAPRFSRYSKTFAPPVTETITKKDRHCYTIETVTATTSGFFPVGDVM